MPFIDLWRIMLEQLRPLRREDGRSIMEVCAGGRLCAIPQSLVHYWPRSVRTSFPAEDRSPLTNINATKAEAA
jgi:hypothetical protein